MIRIRTIDWVVSVLIAWLGATGLQAASWQVGMAKVKITPEEPIWMSGYASRDRAAEGTRTELWAKATAFQDELGNQGLILSLDVVGFGRDIVDPIVAGLNHAAGLRRDQILINASHTHTGPVVGENLRSMYFLDESENRKLEQYAAKLVQQSIAVGLEAIGNKGQRQVSYAVGEARFGVNRRNNPEMLVPKLRFEGQLKGPVDYSVPVLRINDENDRLQGVIFGYACHATTLSDYQWSGDYPGYAQQFLEARYPGIIAQFVAGCGADVNPLPRRKPTLAVNYGRQLAKSVEQVLGGVLNDVSPRLQTQFGYTDLAFESVPSEAELRTQAQSENRYIVARAKKWLTVLGEGGTVPSCYAYPVSSWRFGDTFDLVGMGGEVVVEYAIELKKEYGMLTWVAGYSHDVMAYIPSLRIWKEGGYEGESSMIYYGQPNRWSDAIESDVLETVRRVHAGD